MDDLKSMSAGYIDGPFYHGYSCKGAAELINPVNQSPVPGFHKKWKLLQQPAQEVILKPLGIWADNFFPQPK